MCDKDLLVTLGETEKLLKKNYWLQDIDLF